MKRRSQEDWQALIKQQLAEKISISQFCKQQNISTSCFYLHKANMKILKNRIPSSFVKVQRPLKTHPNTESIKIVHLLTQVNLPMSVNYTWLAELVKALG